MTTYQLSMTDCISIPSSTPGPQSSLKIGSTQGNITFLTGCPEHNSGKGTRKEVYAFKDPADLTSIQQYLFTSSSIRTHLCLRNWLFFTLGINLGLRVSDLCRLQWHHIFIPGTNSFNLTEWNEIIEEKTGKKRQVVLNSAAQKAISFYFSSLGKSIKEINPDDYIFYSQKKTEPHIQPHCIHHILKQAARSCNIAFNVGTHSMRKTFGYMLYHSTGKDIDMVQRILNHSSQQMTLRYIGVDSENVRDAYAAIPDMVWTPGARG